MGEYLEQNYRDWIPSSLFSYLVLGLLSTLFLDSFFPDLVLVWTSIHSINIILFSFLFFGKKIPYFSWGVILFFVLAICGYTKRSAPFLKESSTWKKEFSQKINQVLDKAKIEGRAREISIGLVLGDAKGLDKEFKKNAKEGGILHLFAASGLHLGILIGCMFAVLKRIPFLGYYLPRILPVLFGLLYLACLGFPISLARAWIFSAWILLQSMFFRKSKPADLLISSAGLVYLWDPIRSFGVSFLLSFGAVSGILLLLPCFQKCLPPAGEDKTILTRFIGFWRENLLVSLSAGLGTLPSLIYYFGTYSFGSLGLNLILVPICGILLPLLYFSLVLETMSLSLLARPLWKIVLFLLEILEKTTLYWGESDWNLVHYYRGNTKFFGLGIWFLFLLFLSFWKLLPSDKVKNSELDLSNPLNKKTRKVTLFKKIWLLGFCICCGFQFLLANSASWIQLPDVFFGDRFIFFLQEKNRVVLAGKCKYSSKILYKSLGKDPERFCGNSKTFEIYIEHESCLDWVSECLKRNQNLSLKYGGKEKPKIASLENWNLIPKLVEFHLPEPGQKLIRFDIEKDSLITLSNRTKSGEGIILIIPRFGIKEDLREWNRFRKQLGIAPGWKFIGSDELPGIPIL
ncbi:ComEC/Rec2 family competence protein [Leptospira koniambonensis]|uniref:ComEC/Rec2 family competence protein n=1 Tax=Leptospira koniambonensis TaxID=2484950 RepID=A0A4R9J8Z3_9LEPT|nr:ComEC/Rec2 family competence protein [Leptospira koniambonensis]TGL34698.1 ComEC/Rec2 family competence protein [Leptospira koniambonensis]